MKRFFLLLVPFLLALLASCASGPGPDLRGPQGPSLMSSYSGTWILLRLESDDLASRMRENQAPAGRTGGFGGGMTGGRPGGGMTGRPTGGGMGGARPGGGAFPGQGGGMGPEGVRQAMVTVQALARTPEELSLSLRPEAVEVAYSDSLVVTLQLGADEVQVRQGPLVFFAAAKWTRKGVLVESATDVGSGVKDLFSLDEAGHLRVKREIGLPGGRRVEGTLVYRRKE